MRSSVSCIMLYCMRLIPTPFTWPCPKKVWKVSFFPKKRAEWKQIRSKYCTDNFIANVTDNFFPRTCCIVHKKHDKREPGLFKEEFRCAEMFCLCSKTYCSYDKQTNKHKFSSKGLNKRTLEECGDGGTMSKYRKVLEEAVNVTSTNRGFRRIQHCVATYEQTKRGLSYFHPKRIKEEDGKRTKPLRLLVLITVLIICTF